MDGKNSNEKLAQSKSYIANHYTDKITCAFSTSMPIKKEKATPTKFAFHQISGEKKPWIFQRRSNEKN